jgi:large repetitive protein
MGHELGLAHSADADDVMADTLVDGERRLPDAADLAQANASQVAAAPAAAAAQGFGSALSDAIHAGLGRITSGLGGFDNFVFAKPGAVASAPLTHLADHSFLSGDGFNFSWQASAFHVPAAAGAPFAHAMGDFTDAFAALQGHTNGPWEELMSSASHGQIGARAGHDVGMLIDGHGASYLALFHLGLLA